MQIEKTQISLCICSLIRTFFLSIYPTINWFCQQREGPDQTEWIHTQVTLWEHAYSNILKILQPKTENFQMRILIFFIFLLIDCGYSLKLPQWGGSNEYPQSMLFSKNKKTNVYPCKPLFYNITRKSPDGIMDCFFKNEESESCLSCMWNTCWSSSSSLPNMKAIHWRIKVTYNFEKRLTWDDAQPPAWTSLF